jgi:hypothetical protein
MVALARSLACKVDKEEAILSAVSPKLILLALANLIK